MALRLNSWLVQQGGVRDPGGDVQHSLGRCKDRPGLVNSHGMTLDDAALRAWEAGYFWGPERPDINELLDAIARDHNGPCPVYSEKDMPAVEHESPNQRAIALIEQIVSVWRNVHCDKRKAMRPILRECEAYLSGGR